MFEKHLLNKIIILLIYPDLHLQIRVFSILGVSIIISAKKPRTIRAIAIFPPLNYDYRLV
jgi:hypothetical protein